MNRTRYVYIGATTDWWEVVSNTVFFGLIVTNLFFLSFVFADNIYYRLGDFSLAIGATATILAPAFYLCSIPATLVLLIARWRNPKALASLALLAFPWVLLPFVWRIMDNSS